MQITKPDDWHLHLRDGALLQGVLPATAAHFARALIMPNLLPPVVSSQAVHAYRERILAALPRGHRFRPVMSAYLTEDTDAADLAHGFAAGIIGVVKLYPAGATTNSQSGVRCMERVYPVLERMAAIGMPLCVHGEVTDAAIDIFDREAVFIDTVLEPLRRRIPELRIVLEHITTKEGADYVRSAGANLAATITAHHLIINRNAMFAGGIRPHYYCLPVAKREAHRQALRQAAVGGDGRFFFGSDSAPHVNAAKEAACGCAGIFTAVNAISLLAHVFEEENALHRLEGFTAIHGARFYGLDVNRDKLTLKKNDTAVRFPAQLPTQAGPVTVFDPGFPLYWTCQAVQ